MSQSQEIFRPAFEGREEPRISYGIPFDEAAAKHVEQTFKASRVYIICSGSLSRNTDSLERLKRGLGDKVVGVRIGMKSHTRWSEVLEITNDARRVNADLLITLGAGSLTDGAKIVSFALANDVSTKEELATLAEGPNKRAHINPSVIPIISIPTSLSAGEYSNFAGGTEDTTFRKHSFQKPLKGPRLVILDPKLAATTPDSVWLSSGIRAVDHCVETLCSNMAYEDTDALAEKGLSLLVPGLLRCKRDHEDYEARLNCQLGSVDAMAACTSGKVELGASHGIGHQLGPLGVGHGETSCILLPAVCKWNAAQNANVPRQQRVLRFLLDMPIVAELLQKRGIDSAKADLGDVMDAIIRELGMPRSLKDVNVGRDKLDTLAENSLHDRWCKSNPVPLKEKSQVLEILEMVVG